MTRNAVDTEQEQFPIARRDVLKTTAGAAGFTALGGLGLNTFTGLASAEEHPQIDTCGAALDIVLALDYSGSIGSGLWDDIETGAKSFVDALADDNQLGLVTFGDTAKAYDWGDRDYLKGADSNRSTIKSKIPTSSPPNENGTHMAAALDFANEILDHQGRGESEVIVLLTDGEPNYQNGLVGDGQNPPEDEGDSSVGGVSGWDPSSNEPFDPDEDGTGFTHEYTGGSSGTDPIITDGERDETAARADDAKADGTRIIPVGIGAGVDDSYLRTRIASEESDYVQVGDSSEIGAALTEILTELCEACVVDLVAGQHMDAGTVSLGLDSDAEVLTVTYETTGEWMLEEIHLHVTDDPEDFPTAGKNNPKVGRFDVSEYFDPAVDSATFDIDVSGLDSPYFVAAHAAMEGGETAWAEGCAFNPGRGGNWAMYVQFGDDVCGCE